MVARRLLVLVTCAGLFWIATAHRAAAEETDAEQATKSRNDLQLQLKEVLHERVKIATRCRDAVNEAFEAETATLTELLDAMNALKDTELAAAGRLGTEWRKALQRHVKSMQDVERKTKLLPQVGTKGREAMQYAHAQRERISAEVELLRAQIHEAGQEELRASSPVQHESRSKETPGTIRLLKQ